MRFTFDIGNTSVKVGVFDGATMVFSSFMDHPVNRKPRAYISWLKPLFSRFASGDILIASVYPRLTQILMRAIGQLTDAPVRVLSHQHFPKFKISIDHPKELGIDLLVDAVAANHEYATPCIIIDLGTATKVIGVQKHEFVGVAIAPGLATSFKALQQHTALIPSTHMVKPDLVFGKNTKQSLASGILLGQAQMLLGLIALGKQQLNVEDCPVIITGGYAHYLLSLLPTTYIHDPYLSLKGMQLC